MKFILSVAIALLIVGAGGLRAEAASLKSPISVQADVVKLGDLFTGAGEEAVQVVARSPAPGERLVLNAGQSDAIAKSGGIKWSPDNRFVRAIVTRQARIIDTEEIKNQLFAALRSEGLDQSWHIELGKNDLTAKIAMDEDRPIRILNPRFSVHSKRFSAVLETPSGSRATDRQQVTGTIYQMTEIPVLARRVQRGDIVREHDLEFISLPQEKIGRTTLMDKRQIVGKQARRLVASGKPIRAGDLRPPVMVEKGNLVTLVLRTEKMLISARGKALDNGAAGDIIRVLNTRSKQTIEGVVESRNRVVVAFASGR